MLACVLARLCYIWRVSRSNSLYEGAYIWAKRRENAIYWAQQTFWSNGSVKAGVWTRRCWPPQHNLGCCLSPLLFTRDTYDGVANQDTNVYGVRTIICPEMATKQRTKASTETFWGMWRTMMSTMRLISFFPQMTEQYLLNGNAVDYGFIHVYFIAEFMMFMAAAAMWPLLLSYNVLTGLLLAPFVLLRAKSNYLH